MTTTKCLFLTAKCIVMFELLVTIFGSILITLEHHTNENQLHEHAKFNYFISDSFTQCHLFVPFLLLQLVCAIGLWFNHISAVIILALDLALIIVEYLGLYYTIEKLDNVYWIALLTVVFFHSVNAYLSYNLFTMWMHQKKEKNLKAQDEGKILFNNRMDDGDDDVVHKV